MKEFDPKKHDFRPGDEEQQKRDKAAEEEKQQEGECLDEALEDTFPASDPPAITAPKEKEADDPKSKPRKGEGK